MELTGNRYKGAASLRRMLSTRRGTALVAGACIAAAAAVLVVALANYRHSVAATAQPATVLVASKVIQKGTSGSVISAQGMFRTERIGTAQVTAGAIADASAIQGRVAASDIQPGQQLTLNDFATGGGIVSELAPSQRAISVPLDSSHGLGGVLQAGDRVDVYVGTGSSGGAGSSAGASMKLLLSNVPVLAVNSGGGSGPVGGSATTGASSVVLNVRANNTAALAFASDNNKVWLVLRGAGATGPNAQGTSYPANGGGA